MKELERIFWPMLLGAMAAQITDLAMPSHSPWENLMCTAFGYIIAGCVLGVASLVRRRHATRELPIATGADLDGLAENFGIHRHVEDDASLRVRAMRAVPR